MGKKVDKQLAKIIDDLYSDSSEDIKKVINLLLGSITSIVTIPNVVFSRASKWVVLRAGQKLEKYSESETIQPPSELVGQIIEDSKYISATELHELYAELLKKSAVKEEVHKVHPRFLNILKNLSSDEIKIVELLVNNNILPICFVQLRLRKKGVPEESVLNTVTNIPEAIDKQIIYKKNINLYLDNFVNLGILSKLENQFSEKGIPIYKDLENKLTLEVKKGKFKSYEDTHSLNNPKFLRGHYRLTSIGELFIKSLK